MAIFERGGIRIHYEVRGDGFPVLLLAPGGMRSRISAWQRSPWNPVTALADRFQVIAMDQRNAGESFAPVRADDGWATYTRDQLALLDELGVDRFAIVGMCIGGPYILALAKAAPERVTGAVMFQPIGRDDNEDAFFTMFDGWAEEIAEAHPEADEDTWRSFRENMFGGDAPLFDTTAEALRDIETPMLVLRGDDLYHPSSASRLVAKEAPNATLVEHWKEPEYQSAAIARVDAFLVDHAR